MNIETFVSQHSLQEIIDIEHQDEQFLVIEKNRKEIKKKHTTNIAENILQNTYLFLIIQTALVSYQIAGSGPLRRTEITEQIKKNFKELHILLSEGKSNTEWRYKTLKNSQYNKRIYNNKKVRLEKFFTHYDNYFHVQKTDYQKYYNNLEDLLEIISQIMKQKRQDKTMTFSIKMFSYAARVIYKNFQVFPMSIQIPVDSRLITIAQQENKELIKKTEIQARFQKIAEKHKIPPLHLDSLLWIRYWENLHK